ncbi:MAG TPA: Rv1355c family protein [Cryomorphaceae bacterium]|nr:Rv1355c family protein [Cryomorphaceae bacterium]
MNSLSLITEKLKTINQRNVSDWKPEILNIGKPSDLERFNDILDRHSPIVTDEIYGQIEELVKCLRPKDKLKGQALEQAIKNHLNGAVLEEYGNWIYYSWSNRLVHALGKEEFIAVRTNRNHYKISPAEQKILASKKVGLIGLSVGQSVALTMAMERGFGELRIADFDDLELTNLNRIRTGIHNLGLSKVISVAREIMEIDPYLKLKCFTDGITDGNMHEFLTGDGKLDLLIDECDGLDIKVICRTKAREMKIPVVMEASDRGMVDVERFDLDPNRPLLHGLIGDLNVEKLKTLETNEDKMPYMLDIVGLDTISTRAKASMLEIGETISTWPQLASAVTLGGGITADVVRRIFLNEFTDSGRYYMDVESIIGDKPKSSKEQTERNGSSSIPTPDFGPKIKARSKTQIAPETVNIIAKAACHAPSGGNLQPWRWKHRDSAMQLYHDTGLSSSFLDENYIASYLALGASLENAVLSAKLQGYKPEIKLFPNREDQRVIAEIELHNEFEVNQTDKLLAEHLFERETNRNIETTEPLISEHKDLLCNIAKENGSELLLIEDEEQKKELGALIAFAERFRILHPIGHKNFVDEMRWTAEDAESTRDGIDIETCALKVDELAGFKLARHPDVIDKLKEWEGGTAFEKLSRKSTSHASALGIITREHFGDIDFLKAGRDMERVWIGANAVGLGFQPQSPLTLILQRLEHHSGLNEEQYAELSNAQKRLDAFLKPLTSKNPIFIFRLFYKKNPVKKSLRRELSKHFQEEI